ncbi:hypothetical protein [Erwinia billingiae]|jgi:hypothetical protein|uniref:hypothetical protein n=1 Tax=Erwinia billingiae TaxID=182337 RepID=UPI00320A89DD
MRSADGTVMGEYFQQTPMPMVFWLASTLSLPSSTFLLPKIEKCRKRSKKGALSGTLSVIALKITC